MLIELADNAAVHRCARLVRERLGGRVQDVVPGHLTLLVVWFGDRREERGVIAALERLELPDGDAPEAALGQQHVRIPVRYDGPDLEAVANMTGLTVQAVRELHAGTRYTAAFIGFSPGFAYLIGGDARLDVPRRATPRTRVPAGAVALAAGYTTVYPTAGPGGWQLIGHTDTKLFDTSLAEPALLTPGTQITFEAI